MCFRNLTSADLVFFFFFFLAIHTLKHSAQQWMAAVTFGFVTFTLLKKHLTLFINISPIEIHRNPFSSLKTLFSGNLHTGSVLNLLPFLANRFLHLALG